MRYRRLGCDTPEQAHHADRRRRLGHVRAADVEDGTIARRSIDADLDAERRRTSSCGRATCCSTVGDSGSRCGERLRRRDSSCSQARLRHGQTRADAALRFMASCTRAALSRDADSICSSRRAARSDRHLTSATFPISDSAPAIAEQRRSMADDLGRASSCADARSTALRPAARPPRRASSGADHCGGDG